MTPLTNYVHRPPLKFSSPKKNFFNFLLRSPQLFLPEIFSPPPPKIREAATRHLWHDQIESKCTMQAQVVLMLSVKKKVAYQLDHKSKFRFYLRMFFNLIDIAIVNSHIVYMKLDNSISLLDFNNLFL